MHDSIFDHCIAKDGAGCYICKAKKDRNQNDGEINDELLAQIDVQYCCFQNCKVENDDDKKTGFGSALIVSGKIIQLFYASTVNCPGNEEGTKKARGAQFDIHSNDISSKFVNATGGYSKYCGSIEYRGSSSGSFSFQTIMSMHSMFVISFSKFSQSNTIDISYCNLINNKIENFDSEAGTYPALIHVRQQNIRIQNFAFLNNDFSDDGRIASKEQQKSGKYPEQQIILINCYADSYSEKESEVFQTESCNFQYLDKLTLNNISQLDLGECKGNIPPSELIITSIFTKSEEFSRSEEFSKSEEFTSTNEFTQSKEFPPHDPQNSNEDRIIAGVAVVAIIVVLVTIFVIRKHKMSIIEQEEIETVDSDQNSMNVENPIYNKKAEDDPFKEDFNI